MKVVPATFETHTFQNVVCGPFPKIWSQTTTLHLMSHSTDKSPNLTSQLQCV